MQSELRCETENRPYLIAKDPQKKIAILFQPRCKLWSCPACAEINQKLWALRAIAGVEQLKEAGHELWFTTITSHEKLSPEYALMIWPKAWGKLRQRASRAADTFEYLLVPEQHISTKIHVHLIQTSGLTKKWWKDNARSCGLGYQDDSKRVRNGKQAGYYTTKYLSKQLETNSWPRGFRRVRTSQGWPKLPVMDDIGFSFHTIPPGMALGDLVALLWTEGYEVNLGDHRQGWELIEQLDQNGDLG